MPLNHYFSPLPNLEEIRRREHAIFDRRATVVPGIDLNVDEQLELVRKLAVYSRDVRLAREKEAGLRYFAANDNFSFADAMLLHCMLRLLRPRKVIEVGSGYSSGVILDTNELFLGKSMSCTFIEPYPHAFEAIMKDEDRSENELVRAPVQEVPLDLFAALGPGDVLFIDSSHVAKVGSDVNFLLFEVLPALRAGVWVHVHDVFYPFEYPKEWVYEGRAWNEAYLLRGFLQYNSVFRIQVFSSFLVMHYPDVIARLIPAHELEKCASLWLQKV